VKLYQYFRGSVVALSTVGLLAPQMVIAESPQAAQQQSYESMSLDVALQSGGTLKGQVVDAQGAAQAGLDVIVESRGRQVTQAITDHDGTFSVENLRGGTYVVRAADQVVTCRVWAANTAPPSATDGVLVVTGMTTRAQFDMVRRYGVGSLIVVGGAVTAIVLTATDDAS